MGVVASLALLGATPIVNQAVAHADTVQPTAAPHKPILFPTVEAARAKRAAGSSGMTRFASSGNQPPLHFGGLRNGIGVTLGSPKVYLVFWGSQWGTESPAGSSHFSNDTLGEAPRLISLFNGLGKNNELWSGVVTQYCEGVATGAQYCPTTAPHVPYPSSTVLAGVWADTGLATPNNATPAQLGNEAIAAANHFGNLDPASNRNTQYVIVSPKGTHPNGFNAGGGFCAWHDDLLAFGINNSVGDLAFTNMPYVPDMKESCGQNFVNTGTAGLLDGVTIVEGHEYAETVTDQNPGGGWIDSDGEENADKCVWMSNGVGHIQNVAFSTGNFAMQGSWSNDGQSCAITHPIWGVPGGPFNGLLQMSHSSDYVQPGGVAAPVVHSITVSGDPVSVNLSVSGAPPDSTAVFDQTTTSSQSDTTLTITTLATTPVDTYPMTITETGNGTRTIPYTLNVGPPPPLLQNGRMVSNLSGALNSDQVWEFDVPAAVQELDFAINGDLGDADLYIGYGSIPTDDNRVCRSDAYGDRDWCTFFYRPAGTYFVRVHGAAAYSGLRLQATWANELPLPNRVPMLIATANPGDEFYYFVNAPAGTNRVTIKMSMKTGDADLYSRIFGVATPVVNDCAPLKGGRHSETCTFKFKGGLRFAISFGVSVYTVGGFTEMKLLAKTSP